MMDNSLSDRKKLHHHENRDENLQLGWIFYLIIFHIHISNLFAAVIDTPVLFSAFRFESLSILSIAFSFQASLFTLSKLWPKFISLTGY